MAGDDDAGVLATGFRPVSGWLCGVHDLRTAYQHCQQPLPTGSGLPEETRMTLLISGNRSLAQRGFRFGILDGIVNSRLSPTVLARASYLTAAATGADSFWVGDHLNAFLPRSIATTEYFGVQPNWCPRLTPSWNRGRCLDISPPKPGAPTAARRVRHRRQSPQSSGHGAGRRDSASAYPGPRHPRYRCRRTRRQRTLRRRMDETGGTV